MLDDPILNAWQDAQTLAPKQKYAVLRQLCNDIICAVKTQQLSLQQIDSYSQMLNQCIRIVGFPARFTVARTQLNLKRLALLGITPENIRIVVKKTGIVTTESACLGVGDPAMLTTEDKSVDLSTIRQKRRLVWDVGADGKYRIEIRLIDCPEPMLELKDYKNLAAATQIVQIDTPNGILNVSDSVAPESTGAFSIAIEPGLYNICTYLLISKSGNSKYVVVATTAGQEMNNDLEEFPRLEPCW